MSRVLVFLVGHTLQKCLPNRPNDFNRLLETECNGLNL
jgi:hypothetical protein